MGALMGGGLGDLFLGHGFGPGFGHGRFGYAGLDDACAWNAAAGRVVCDVETRGGLTVERSFSFQDRAGATQTAFDSLTTNTINARVRITGTVTRRDSVTSTVEHTSDRTVSGLAAGSPQRTVNGASAGRESTSGRNAQGAFTALRIMGDTTKNVIVPVESGKPAYPVSGTVTRSMQVTLTYAGQSPSASTRREVVTYDGSDTAKLVITQDGVTKNCTIPLPRGRPTCS
jgi:hypothetical protein